jgi:hypothetical protein
LKPKNGILKAKGKAAAAQPDAKSNPKSKASQGSSKQVPMKARSEKFCQHFKTHSGPHQTHNTSGSHCYYKDGKQHSAATGKPSNA